MSIPVPHSIIINIGSTTKEEFDQIITGDMYLYDKYFDEIRDHIIENINAHSTSSLITALETCHTHERQRLQQVDEIYNYCISHPNNIAANDNDFILGVLLASSFEYDTETWGSDSPVYDEFFIVDKFLEETDLDHVGYCHDGYTTIYVSDIEKALKILTPKFKCPQPSFHCLMDYRIEALNRLARS